MTFMYCSLTGVDIISINFLKFFFNFQQCAAQALLKTDGLQVGNHTISVAISNPPSRKTPLAKREETSFVPSLGGGKKETSRYVNFHCQLNIFKY